MPGESIVVSILMPLKNAGQFVELALKSILVESDFPLEIIVANDSSTDDSIAHVIALNDPRIILIDSKETGIARTLNVALGVARGSIVMRCDADDLFPAGRIREQLALFDQYRDYDAICGSFSTLDSRGEILLKMTTGTEPVDITDELTNGRSRTHLCTYAIRARAVRRMGGFRTYFETAEDLDFQFRLASVGRVFYFPQDWYRYRIHSNSVTHRQASERRLFFARMATEFAVQRQTDGLDLLERGASPAPPQLADLDAHDANAHVQDLLVGKAWRQFENGHSFGAFRTGMRAIAVRPGAIRVWQSTLVLAYRAILKWVMQK